jgi:predicted DNA-binding protein (UPF0251 family)
MTYTSPSSSFHTLKVLPPGLTWVCGPVWLAGSRHWPASASETSHRAACWMASASNRVVALYSRPDATTRYGARSRRFVQIRFRVRNPALLRSSRGPIRRTFGYEPAKRVSAVRAVPENEIRHAWFVTVAAELKSIRPAEASAVVLSYFYEMTPTKIADELGVSRREVHHLMSQGLTQLGRALVKRDAHPGHE